MEYPGLKIVARTSRAEALDSLLLGEGVKVERRLLKNQVLEVLRDCLLSGQFSPGTPLIEREWAERLGVSRNPVREALMQLESEGLVVSKPGGRYVVTLAERDINELYQVRLLLERLAVRLAAQNVNDEAARLLVEQSQLMARAIAQNDVIAYRRSDVETHRVIWRASGNRHLHRALETLLGPIFMLVARHAEHFDWSETYALHEELVNYIVRRCPDEAEQSIERHIQNAWQRSLRLHAMGLL